MQLEGVRLHLGIYIYIYHRALVLKCLCIDAVLERNRNRVYDKNIQNVLLYSLSFNLKNIHLSLDPSVCMTTAMHPIHLS